MVIEGNSITSGGWNMRFYTSSTKVQQSVPECEIMCFNTERVYFNIEKVQKVWNTIDNGYWLIIISKIYCMNKAFSIILVFDYFDISVSIYFWRHLLTLVVGTASVTLVDNAKQASLVGCSGSYWSKSHPVATFFKVKVISNHLYIYVKL